MKQISNFELFRLYKAFCRNRHEYTTLSIAQRFIVNTVWEETLSYGHKWKSIPNYIFNIDQPTLSRNRKQCSDFFSFEKGSSYKFPIYTVKIIPEFWDTIKNGYVWFEDRPESSQERKSEVPVFPGN